MLCALRAECGGGEEGLGKRWHIGGGLDLKGVEGRSVKLVLPMEGVQ